MKLEVFSMIDEVLLYAQDLRLLSSKKEIKPDRKYRKTHKSYKHQLLLAWLPKSAAALAARVRTSDTQRAP